MSDHPSTFEGTPETTKGVNWGDRAALHGKDDGGGVLDGAKALRRGTFADIIAHLMLMPETEREQYVIEKAGDRKYSAAEAKSLAQRSDFPRND